MLLDRKHISYNEQFLKEIDFSSIFKIDFSLSKWPHFNLLGVWYSFLETVWVWSNNSVTGWKLRIFTFLIFLGRVWKFALVSINPYPLWPIAYPSLHSYLFKTSIPDALGVLGVCNRRSSLLIWPLKHKDSVTNLIIANITFFYSSCAFYVCIKRPLCVKYILLLVIKDSSIFVVHDT